MIKTIVGGGGMITVYQSNHTPYISPGAQSAGLVRWNTNNSVLEVYDGVAWRDITTTVTVDISPQYEAVIKWAKDEMIRQQRITELAKKYPLIGELRDKLEVMTSLLTEENNEPSA